MSNPVPPPQLPAGEWALAALPYNTPLRDEDAPRLRESIAACITGAINAERAIAEFQLEQAAARAAAAEAERDIAQSEALPGEEELRANLLGQIERAKAVSNSNALLLDNIMALIRPLLASIVALDAAPERKETTP
jgi:hypothetical protein